MGMESKKTQKSSNSDALKSPVSKKNAKQQKEVKCNPGVCFSGCICGNHCLDYCTCGNCIDKVCHCNKCKSKKNISPSSSKTRYANGDSPKSPQRKALVMRFSNSSEEWKNNNFNKNIKHKKEEK